MVELALLIGIYSYLVLGFGILGYLNYLGYLGIGSAGFLAIFIHKKGVWKKVKTVCREIQDDKISLWIVGLIFFQVIVNFVGALGPELGFDALWYHLTIPKIYLQWGRIFFIPGNLFYYSVMPKLTEILYLITLIFSPYGTLAKILHFSFGIFSAVALYNLARRYLKSREAFLVVLIFYSTLIVGWESITAYVDLARTFFEILALDLFLQWKEKAKNLSILVESALMLGLAVSTKIIAFASLPIFLILIIATSRQAKFALYYLFSTLLVPLPWFIFAYLNTGNPVYPVFSGLLDNSHKIVNFGIARFLNDLWNLFYRPQDPISPIFLIFLPVIFWKIIRGEMDRKLKPVAAYVFLAMIFWFFTPRTGGSRFFLPYLPGMSFLVVGLILKDEFFKRALIFIAIFISVVNISYRLIANKKFIPFLLGLQSRTEFLEKNLNFQNGDFLDINGDIKKIVGNGLVLIDGFHNLFYVDFPFIHSSFAKQDLPISYVLVRDNNINWGIKEEKLIYRNRKTSVNLYLFQGKLE